MLLSNVKRNMFDDGEECLSIGIVFNDFHVGDLNIYEWWWIIGCPSRSYRRWTILSCHYSLSLSQEVPLNWRMSCPHGGWAWETDDDGHMPMSVKSAEEMQWRVTTVLTRDKRHITKKDRSLLYARLMSCCTIFETNLMIEKSSSAVVSTSSRRLSSGRVSSVSRFIK